jgi:fumarate hydratase class I/fumarate hydratase subunit beta
MTDARHIHMPLSLDVREGLHVGEKVLLSGPVMTARDATHARILEHLEREGELPFGLAGQTLFYAGPTPAAADRPVGSVGPTTAKRMDAATPALLDAGIVATIGKGARGKDVRRACVRDKAPYLATVGGSAALLATHVVSLELVAWPELGTEALMRMVLDELPAYVAIDVHGNDVYESAPAKWRATYGGDR